ncbi:hypothetical protein Rsub_00287 [Raphidocelis subcapitata]|uniref:Tyrosine-protein kinase ephrin type A/B receptor-like domain-containing protein n=1 Tax=Raphidocelis subcapitata TaxID=307507 RepID=A0A2V0NJY5_9CHLO|nr:hypothetical protein Rsub_00287 [Raphidocelis subcapitata]|eukprot:GBF87576.1 hypothetical protein Rsub_00287 [Raphidocelis subcapitata]
MTPRRPRGGGPAGRAARLAAALLLVALAALAPAPAAAACGIRHCAKCKVLPKWRPGRGGVGRQLQCLQAKQGYQMATDRRSVPNCAAGYVAKRKGGLCRPCGPDTFAPSHPIGSSNWRECRKCPVNTQSNAFSTRCVANPGYYGMGNPCPENYYCAGGSAWRCLPGLNTDGETAQKDCNWVDVGYYMRQGNPTPCPVGFTSNSTRPKSQAKFCEKCPDGLTTDGAGGTGCNILLPGYFIGNGTNTAQPCPVNTYQPNRVNVNSAPNSCTACDTGSNTFGATAQAKCFYLNPGFFYDTNTTKPQACVVGTFQNYTAPPKKIPDFTACIACDSKEGTAAGWGPGYGTCFSTGSTYCRCIAVGYNNTGSLTKPTPTACPVNTFRKDPLPWSDLSSQAPCDSCLPNQNTNGLTAQTTCLFVDAGYRYDGSATAACIADTYAPLRAKTDPAIGTCPACVTGSTTNGATAQASCLWLKPGYLYNNSTKKPAPCSDPFISNTTRLISDAGSGSCPTNCTTLGLIPNNANTACISKTNTTSAEGSVYIGDESLQYTGAPPDGSPQYGPPPDGYPQRYGQDGPPPDGEPPGDGGTAPRGSFWDYVAGRPAPCPPDTHASEARGRYEAGSCEPCPPGLTTDGAEGQAECLWVRPGYLYFAGAAARCPRDTFSGALRGTADAANCTPCFGSTTTGGADGQTECLSDAADERAADTQAQAQAPPASYAPARIRVAVLPSYAHLGD